MTVSRYGTSLNSQASIPDNPRNNGFKVDNSSNNSDLVRAVANDNNQNNICSCPSNYRDLLSNSELNEQSATCYAAVRKINSRSDDPQTSFEKMVRYANKQGINKPSGSIDKAIKRFLNISWWKRAIKSRDLESFEHERRVGGLVSRKKSVYASAGSRKLQTVYDENLEEYLKSKTMVNESTGEMVTMWEMTRHTNLNAVVKLAEITKRLDGMKDQAEKEGLVCRFITITCPSKYHRFTGSKFNPKFNEAETAKDANKYLSSVIRAAHKGLFNAGIPVIGMRVLEPHHEGCPHLHAVVFAKPDQIEEAIAIYKQQALLVDGDEIGAKKRRFDCKTIKQGESVVGYLMKYLSKNLGQETDLIDDQTGKKYSESNNGIAAWVRINSIVQFAFWGDCGIGVFRQLYNVEEVPENKIIKAMVEAAKDNDYGAYIELQGGLGTKIKDCTVKAFREVVGTNGYSEDVLKITHLECCGDKVKLKSSEWIEVPLTETSEARSLEVIKRLPEQATELDTERVDYQILSQTYDDQTELLNDFFNEYENSEFTDENTELLRDRRQVLRW